MNWLDSFAMLPVPHFTKVRMQKIIVICKKEKKNNYKK